MILSLVSMMKSGSAAYTIKPVDHGNTINADEQLQQEPNIFFLSKKR
jgi:hypothetical protein